MQSRSLTYSIPSLSDLGYTPAENRSVTPVPQWAKDLVPKPIGKNETVISGHEDVITDTMPLIKSKIRRTLYHTKKLAPKLKGSTITQTLRNDWNFIFKHIKYVKDVPGKEQIRSPRRLIHEGKGDCDCFTVTLSSLLLNQGIPHFLRIMKETDRWSHIYIVVPKDGDVKKKLTSRNQYIVMDCVTHEFNFEPPHSETKDFAMALEYLDGLGNVKGCPTKPISEQLTRYIYTDQVVERGLVPTRQFLQQKNIPAIPQSDGSFQVSTSKGMINVPSIITPTQAEALAADADDVITPEVIEEQTNAELVKAEASLAPKKMNWLWWLVVGGLGLVLLTGEEEEESKKTKPKKLDGYKPKKKSLKTLRI